MSRNNKQIRLLDEKAVLQMLGISDFRHMSKENIVQFISAIPQMDPAVATKVIEQFPAVKDMALGMAKELRQGYEKAIDANNEDSKPTYDSVDAVIEVLSKELDKDDYTPEQRLQLIDKICEQPRIKQEVHKDNQSFIMKGLRYLGLTVLGIGAAAIAVLGVNGNIQLPSIGDSEDEEDA